MTDNAADPETDTLRDDDPSLAWETLSSRTAYDCPGFSITHDAVRLPDGTETSFDYLTEPSAVVILPFTSEDEVVVIEEWRQAVKRVNRGLPVGSVEPDDDDLATAAQRELREETGYEAERVEPLCSVEPTNGVSDSILHYFVAEGCEPTGQLDLDANESIRPSTTTIADLREAARTGALRDGRAVLAVTYYELFGDERNS